MTTAQLYGPKGETLYTKQKPPKTGNAFAQWAGRDFTPYTLPGGGFLQFDLSRLTLVDYRQMTLHYQINSSLSLLAFMQHQSKWKINHSSAKVRALLTENLQQIWTELSASMSQANWCGYAPSALEWDNYSYDKTTRITGIKDLHPEECRVNWKEVDLWAPPGQIPLKDKVYDGIKKLGQSFPIPTENTFWYPIMMQNGDYYGRKLLQSVYTSYFFSNLIHLFANRYYERFGEPTPIGRAPLDDDISVQGQSMSGSELMMGMLQNLRSRGVVLLPSDKVDDAQGRGHYEYDIQYLESQMRGADFERLMQRYDQEMSLGTFTPLLLQQTADVGSYNLGGLHYQMYLMTQNAMNADRAIYINRYILAPMMRYNFSASMEPAYIEFETQDNKKGDLIQLIIQGMLAQGTLGFDLNEIGQSVGLSLHEIKALSQPTTDPTNPQNDPTNPPADPNAKGDKTNDPTGSGKPDPVPAGGGGSKNRIDLRNEIAQRVRGQVGNAMHEGRFGPQFEVNIPFLKKINEEFGKFHAAYIERELTKWTKVAVSNPAWLGAEAFVAGFMDVYDNVIRT